MDDTPRWLWFVLQGYLCSLPLCLIPLVGILLSILRWRRHPQVSLLALSGCGLLLVVWLVTPPVYWFVIPFMAERLSPAGQYHRLISSAVNFLHACAVAAAWVMLLMALFGWRGRPTGAAASPTSSGGLQGPASRH